MLSEQRVWESGRMKEFQISSLVVFFSCHNLWTLLLACDSNGNGTFPRNQQQCFFASVSHSRCRMRSWCRPTIFHLYSRFYFRYFNYFPSAFFLLTSCVADNSLGRSKKYIEVSGRPGPAQFTSAPWSKSPESYNLSWKVESYPPLGEVRLLYRKLMVW